jgi:hypothetical protein
MGSTTDKESGDLSRLDERRLAELFQQRGNDLQLLDALDEEFKRRRSTPALKLRIKVIEARRALRTTTSKEPAVSPLRPGSVREWLHAFLAARGIERPTGRALYRYRMTDFEYEQARSYSAT